MTKFDVTPRPIYEGKDVRIYFEVNEPFKWCSFFHKNDFCHFEWPLATLRNIVSTLKQNISPTSCNMPAVVADHSSHRRYY